MKISNSRAILILGLFILDLWMVYSSFNYGAAYLVYKSVINGSVIGIVIIESAVVMSAYLFGGYALRRQLSYWHIPGQMLMAVLLALVITTVAGFITKLTETDANFWRTQLLLGMALVYFWLSLSRFMVRLLLQKMTDEPRWILLGEPTQTEKVEQDMLAVYGEGVFEHRQQYQDIDEQSLLSSKIDALVVVPTEVTTEIENKLLDLRFRGVRVFNVSEYYERYLFKIPIRFLNRRWFATTAEFGLVHHEVVLRVKRMVDLILSIMLLILTMPIMLFAAIAIFIQDRGHIFYSQIRTGVDGKSFNILKFRTMIQNAEQQGKAQWASENDSRVTPVGKFLRLTRIDELPQLWNVFRGEMSFIGPRPERPEIIAELEKNIPLFQYRHSVKPGITGWAQVMYRYGASEEDAEKKLEYDLYYIRNYSLMLDIFIVLRTCRVVLFGMGR